MNQDMKPSERLMLLTNFKIVEGVLSHQLKQFVIDGNKIVTRVANPDTRVDDVEFEENEVDKVNERMMSKLPSREKVCYSSDSVSDVDIDLNYDESMYTT